MTRSRTSRNLLLGLALETAAAGFAADSPGPPARLEWTFDRPGDLEGWRPNAHFANVVVTNGVIECRTLGSDPILELVSPIELSASPWQSIEVRLRADREGTAEWFWSNTSEGRFGGFFQAKSTRFQVRGDGAWQSCRVFPFWQAEGRIVRLRLDLFDGAEFALDAIRVGELETPREVEAADFTFTNTTCGWRAVGEAGLESQAAGLAASVAANDAFLLAPPVRLHAETESFLSLQMAVDRGRYATLLFATEKAPGLHRFPFPLESAVTPGIYNLDLLAAPEWQGRVIALGLQPSDVPGAKATLSWLKVGASPQGPPQVKVRSFGADAAMLRADRPAQLVAVVANVGAAAITNLEAALIVLQGLGLRTNADGPALAARLGFDEETVFRWTVAATRPIEATVRLEVRSAATPTVTAECRLDFLPGLNLPPADQVPEPMPVRGAFEVGAYYFPGWRSESQWQPLRGFPERRPVLGWYPEGSPEVADWHIKWAVEHGITFFAYDWYWSQGARQLDHALHEGFFRARYRHLLKFCLLWANHNAPGTHSHDDCLAVTRHWIETYFRRPEYLEIAAQPVVILFSPQRLTEDLGSDGVRRAFEAMREECRRAGLAGLRLVACVTELGEARRAATEGYDAITAYTWPGLGMTGGGRSAPFATVVDGYRRHWEYLDEQTPIPLLLPLCGGWDSRPWHGENNLVRYGRTPALFREHLEDARRFLEVRASKPETRDVRSAIRNLVLIEAWNEWGEGSYIEPHQEFGFGYLDAIREVFTDAPRGHTDLMPADVGLGPYELPSEPPGRTAWAFEADDEGWGHGMNLADLRVNDGVLTVRTTGNDPAFFGSPLQVPAGDFRAVEVRMKLTPGDGRAFRDAAQLFWRTTRLPETEATSLRFAVTADGAWHTYRVPVAESVRWRGVVSRLRLDPCSRPEVEVGLDYLRLVP